MSDIYKFNVTYMHWPDAREHLYNTISDYLKENRQVRVKIVLGRDGIVDSKHCFCSCCFLNFLDFIKSTLEHYGPPNRVLQVTVKVTPVPLVRYIFAEPEGSVV